MDSVEYVTNDTDILPCKSDVILSKTSAAKFADGAQPVLASHRRLLCMNAKQPNMLRVLNRHGKHKDMTIQATTVAHLVSTEKVTGHPTLFYAVGGKDLAIICPTTQANGDIAVSVVEAKLDEVAHASTAGESQRLYVLGQQNVLEVEESTGIVKDKIALTAKTVVEHPVIDYHQSAQLLVVPAKQTHLDLVSTRTHKSVLGRVWEPHEDAVPTFACFFQHHAFTEEPGKELLLMTAAQGNREIRFWAYHAETQKFTLKQQLHLSHKEDATESYDISVTADEEYITLCSRIRPYAVVIETHHSLFKAYRITSWRMAGAALCSTTSIGKVAETVQSKSVSYELFITIRTETGFVQSMPNSSRLAGATNLTVSKGDSVMNWFPSMAVAGGVADAGNPGAAGGAGAGAAGAVMTPITAVSSSLTGESKTSGMSDNAVSMLVRNQAQKFCEQVKLIDADLVAMQKTTSNTMQLLQDSRYRTEAQNSGRTFAVRNRARLEKTTSTVASPSSQNAPAMAVTNNADAEYGVMSESEKDLVLSIRNFVQEVQGGSAAAAAAALKLLLAKQLHLSVARAAGDASRLDVQGPVLRDLNGTESMAAFRRVVDESLKSVSAVTRHYQDLNRATLEASAMETERRLTAADAFTQRLTAALGGLKAEMAEVTQTLSRYQLSASGGAAAAEPAAVDPAAVVAAAVRLAEADDWKGAMMGILAADDIGILLAFLESPACVEHQAVLTSPKTLPIPLFLSLCLQLSFEMPAQPGSMPLRLQLLSDFVVEWDDYLRNIRQQAPKDTQQAALLEMVRRELATVHASLETVPRNELDRKSRSKERLVHKLITQLLTDE